MKSVPITRDALRKGGLIKSEATEEVELVKGETIMTIKQLKQLEVVAHAQSEHI